jgi:hypothetical protein
LVIIETKAWPDPYTGKGPATIAVKLGGACDQVTLRIFTKAMVCVGTVTSGPQSEGWAEIPLAESVASLPNGLYYYLAQASRAGAETPTCVGKMLLAR